MILHCLGIAQFLDKERRRESNREGIRFPGGGLCYAARGGSLETGFQTYLWQGRGIKVYHSTGETKIGGIQDRLSFAF